MHFLEVEVEYCWKRSPVSCVCGLWEVFFSWQSDSAEKRHRFQWDNIENVSV